MRKYTSYRYLDAGHLRFQFGPVLIIAGCWNVLSTQQSHHSSNKNQVKTEIFIIHGLAMQLKNITHDFSIISPKITF